MEYSWRMGPFNGALQISCGWWYSEHWHYWLVNYICELWLRQKPIFVYLLGVYWKNLPLQCCSWKLSTNLLHMLNTKLILSCIRISSRVMTENLFFSPLFFVSCLIVRFLVCYWNVFLVAHKFLPCWLPKFCFLVTPLKIHACSQCNVTKNTQYMNNGNSLHILCSVAFSLIYSVLGWSGFYVLIFKCCIACSVFKLYAYSSFSNFFW